MPNDDRRLMPTMRLRLAVAQAIAREGQPVPVTGTGYLADGTAASVVGFIDPEHSTFELRCVMPGKAPALPRGRRPDDGRRIAVLMLYYWLTDKSHKPKLAKPYLLVSSVLGYAGSEEARKNAIMRILRNERTKALAEEIKGRLICGAITPEGEGHWFMADCNKDLAQRVLGEGDAITGWKVYAGKDKGSVVYGTLPALRRDLPTGEPCESDQDLWLAITAP